MGAKNCPETPRQKMIGMMYLVLTAMLALNVSADVLDAFTKVQLGLSAVIKSTESKNSEEYTQLVSAYNENKTKVEPYKVKADQVKTKSKEVYDFIESLKVRMVSLADGLENGIDPETGKGIDFETYNVESKSNLDIAGQIMLNTGEKQGVELKKKLDEYCALACGLIDPKTGQGMIDAFHKYLNTADSKDASGSKIPWEQKSFESVPLAGVLTLLTLYQSNILNIESDVVKYLISSVDAGSFTFNKLEARIIPKSNYVLEGDKFEADILLMATDTTMSPEVIANGKSLKYSGSSALYSEVTNTVGPHKVSGVINYKSKTGVLKFDFSTDYTVGKPNVVVSPTKMNVFYLGVDNPVEIAAPGFTPEQINPQISNGSLKKAANGYIVRPGKEGEAIVSVFVTMNGQSVCLQKQKFRVKRVPDPIPMVGKYKSGEKLTKNEILGAGGVKAVLENFDFDMKFEVVSFNVFTMIDGYIQDAPAKGATFTSQQKSLINKLKRGQLFGVEKIMAKGPDGVVRPLPSLSYRIN